jgi:NagD protein
LASSTASSPGGSTSPRPRSPTRRRSSGGWPLLQALRTAGRWLGAPLRELAVVEDDPELKVPMAHCGGSLAVAVASGIAGVDACAHLPRRRRPHPSVRGVDELLALYERACGGSGRT